jgi:hypothetical protein
MGELLRSLFEDRIDVDYRLTTAVRPARVSASMTPGAS